MKAIIFIFLLILFVFPAVLLAQSGGFDWGGLGVDVVVVGVIITIVQILKRYMPQGALAWLPLIIAMGLSAAYGAFSNVQMGIDGLIKMAFTYAAAAAWLYEASKTIGMKKVLKGKREIDK